MLKIRLRRVGTRNRPYFRVVVSDSRSTPKAAALEQIGHYDPLQEPPVIEIDRARVDYWVGNGAILSSTVEGLLRRTGGGSEVAASV